MKSIEDVGGRHPGFRDRRPHLPPLPPPEPEGPPGPPHSPLPVSALWATVLAAVASVLIGVVWIRPGAEAHDRRARAEALLSFLAGAARQYRTDHGALPPGDGLGSAELRRALSGPGPRGNPYVVVSPEHVDEVGHFQAPGVGRIRYRPLDSGDVDLWIGPRAAR
jgi:hypothetical protein